MIKNHVKFIQSVKIILALIFITVTSLFLISCSEEEVENSTSYKNYVITYNLNGGGAVCETETVFNENAHVLPTPIKEGYFFLGWYENENFEGSPISVIPKGNENDFTLYANYEQGVTITYHLDGGTHDNPTLVKKGSNLDLQTPTKEGFVFINWFDNPDFSGDAITSITVNENLEFYAIYSIAHTITYNLDGGENNANNPLVYGEHQSVTLLPPTKLGYAFKGFIDENGEEISIIPIGSAKNFILTAIFEKATYSLTWNLNGGESNAVYPKSYVYGDGVDKSVFVSPTRNGYVFCGWYSNDNYLSSISKEDNGDKVINAKWLEYTGEITFTNLWSKSTETPSKEGTLGDNINAKVIAIPDYLLDIANDGKLHVEIKTTFTVSVIASGNATGNLTANFFFNGKKSTIVSVSKKGGGYSFWNGLWTAPCKGDKGTATATKTQSYLVNADSFTLGYQYFLTSDKKNDDVTFEISGTCNEISYKFYVA